jgi:hypothetical protein
VLQTTVCDKCNLPAIVETCFRALRKSERRLYNAGALRVIVCYSPTAEVTVTSDTEQKARVGLAA